jgi:hypothetical protein
MFREKTTMRGSLSAVVLGALAAISACARTPLAPVRPEAPTREAVIHDLRDGQLVRLAGPELARREGRLLEVGRSELVLATDAQPVRVPAAKVDSVWVRGRATGTGALVGGVVGALAGVGAGLVISQVFCNNSDCDAGGEAVLGLGVGGLAGGALLGALVGSAFPKWRLRFP